MRVLAGPAYGIFNNRSDERKPPSEGFEMIVCWELIGQKTKTIKYLRRQGSPTYANIVFTPPA